MKAIIRKVLTSKYFFFPVAFLLIYALFVFFLVPPIVRWYVPRYTHDKLQCDGRLDKVRTNPFLLTFEANGFNLSQSDGSSLAAFDRLFIDFEMKSFFRWATIFKEITLENPAMYVVIEPDGVTNLQKLVPKSSEPREPEKQDTKPFRMLMQNIAIRGGKIAVIDRRQSEPADFNFDMFDLNFKDVSTLQDHNGIYAFTAKTPQGEKIDWEGKISLTPLSTSGKLNIIGFKVETLWKFVRDSVNLDTPQGKFNVATHYQLDTSKVPLEIVLKKLTIGLTGLSFKLHDSDKPFLELDNVELDAPLMDLPNKNIQISKLKVGGGIIGVQINENGSLNLQRILRKTQVNPNKPQNPNSPIISEPALEEASLNPSMTAETGVTPDAEDKAVAVYESPFKVEISDIDLHGIAANLEDLSRATPVQAGISDISLRLKANIESGSNGTKVVLRKITSALSAVEIKNSQNSGSLFHADNLTVDDGNFDLGSHSVIVDRLALNNGHIDVSMDKEGQLNWLRLIDTKGAKHEAALSETDEASEPTWKFLLKSFEINGFGSKLSDFAKLPSKPICNVKDLNIKVNNIDGKSPMDFDLGFQIEEGGRAYFSGTVDPSVPSVDAKIKANRLSLTPLQPYLEPFITLALKSGSISTQGRFRYGIAKAKAKIAYEGDFSLDELSLFEVGANETFLGLDSLKVPQYKLTLEPNTFEAKEVILDKTLGEFIIEEDGTVNLSKILKGRSKNADTPMEKKPTDGKNTFQFNIGKVRIESGNTLFADLSLFPKFRTRIHDLKGTISGLSSAKDTVANIQLDGKVDEYGLARINGLIRLYDFKQSSDIGIVFRNVEMTSLSPYSGKFAGRQIKSGKLSTDLKYKIQDSKLVGDNNIIVDNLFLGERVDSPNAVNLPLNLAIALLKDSNGRIDIGLPVTGDLSNPQFKIGPLVWKTLINLLTKVVTSPFRALGGLLGGDETKFDEIEFDAGSAELLPPEKEKLKTLAEAMQKRPELKLVVQGLYTPEADGMEFKNLNICVKVATLMGDQNSPDDEPGPLDITDSKTQDILEDLYEDRFGKSALDELEEEIKNGTIKPRMPANQEDMKKKNKKEGRFSRMMTAMKLYRVIPGGKSPEEASAWAGELYVRLVESEPISEETLIQLAQNRAQAIVKEMENPGGIPIDRLSFKAPEAKAEEAGTFAKLSLDAM